MEKTCPLGISIKCPSSRPLKFAVRCCEPNNAPFKWSNKKRSEAAQERQKSHFLPISAQKNLWPFLRSGLPRLFLPFKSLLRLFFVFTIPAFLSEPSSGLGFCFIAGDNNINNSKSCSNSNNSIKSHKRYLLCSFYFVLLMRYLKWRLAVANT